MLIVARSFLSVNSSVSAFITRVSSSSELASRHYHLLTSLILAAIHAIKHFSFLNCFIVGGITGLWKRFIGYYGGNFCTSSAFEHCLANADGLLLERVLRPGLDGVW